MANSKTTHDYFESGVSGFGKGKYPIIFHEKYNISLYGLEYLHSFDTHKWQKAYQLIKDYFKDDFLSLFPLQEADENVLLIHHKVEFLKDILYNNASIALAAEVPFLYWLPNSMLRSKLIEPFKWHTSGTILAFKQAITHGAAVNLGGGFHHSSRDTASGFCFFSDIWIGIRYLWKNVSEYLKFFIVDLDAHQGDGHEYDQVYLSPQERRKILTFDMYNRDIFPKDELAKTFINYNIQLKSGTSNDEYMDELKKVITKQSKEIKEFKPDLVIYNAGTDVLEGDPLGLLSVTEHGIIERDEFIFKFCAENGFPIAFLMSGGYQRNNAQIVANSIINLIELRLLKRIEE